jgi:hypothetical protein
VEYYQNRLFKVAGPVAVNTQRNPITYAQARSALLGPIRMETPVLYFYAPQRQVVNVRVAFPEGFITEWYPKATVNQTPVRTDALTRPTKTGATISWPSVEVLPYNASAIFPRNAGASHYYAARKTDANPIRIGAYDEKFLFYRGVGGFPVPMNVTVTPAGKIAIKHLAGKPSVILFENRGGKIGYTVVDTSKNDVVLDTPPLTSNFDALREELQAVLVGQGLYGKEAQAMIETWRDSWFEEGTRIFYIVPSKMVDTILPLTITPKPREVARVFVGRIEVFTPQTLKTVENAIDAKDTKIVNVYGRFLGPIMERLPEAKRSGNASLLDAAFRDYVQQASSCGK